MCRWMPPSLYQACLPVPVMEEVDKQVAMAVEPLLIHLLPNPTFIQAATAQSQGKNTALIVIYV